MVALHLQEWQHYANLQKQLQRQTTSSVPMCRLPRLLG